MRFCRNPYNISALFIVIIAAVLFSVYYTGFDISAGEFRLTQPAEQQKITQETTPTQQNVQIPLTVQGTKTGTKKYFYGAGLIASKQDSTTIYYHNDYLGSVRLQSDVNARKVFASRTAPFGSDVSVSGSSGGSENSYKFTGQEQDTSLYYYGARYYDTKTGRFTQLDPVLSAESPYAYVSSNPLKYIDPDGKLKYEVIEYVQGLHQNEVEHQLEQFKYVPSSISDHLDLQGVIITFVEGKITDYSKSLQYFAKTIPRGWGKNSPYRYENLPGVYSPVDNKVFIGIEGDYYGHGSCNLILHEYGHALDYQLFSKRLSKSSEFRQIHDLYKDQLNFYEKDSPEEFFAESFARYYNNEESRRKLEAEYPEIVAYIKGIEDAITDSVKEPDN